MKDFDIEGWLKGNDPFKEGNAEDLKGESGFDISQYESIEKAKAYHDALGAYLLSLIKEAGPFALMDIMSEMIRDLSGRQQDIIRALSKRSCILVKDEDGEVKRFGEGGFGE